MSDTPNNPQPTDPPTNTGGGTSNDAEENETADTTATDPPTNTGGGGNT
jgi:hypothetical protein